MKMVQEVCFFATNANHKNESVQIAVQLEQGEFLIRDNVLYEVQEDGTQKKTDRG